MRPGVQITTETRHFFRMFHIFESSQVRLMKDCKFNDWPKTNTFCLTHVLLFFALCFKNYCAVRDMCAPFIVRNLDIRNDHLSFVVVLVLWFFLRPTTFTFCLSYHDAGRQQCTI